MSAYTLAKSRLVYPGDVLMEIINERGITQTELAIRTGFSKSLISGLMNYKKDIAPEFALALEYALGLPKSFWINLQTAYDIDLLDINEHCSISDEERQIAMTMDKEINELMLKGCLDLRSDINEKVLQLRRSLRISNLGNLKKLPKKFPES